MNNSNSGIDPVPDGIPDVAHRWIRAFLTQRTQSLQVDGSHSSKVHVESGVPQGIVHGPLLFPRGCSY